MPGQSVDACISDPMYGCCSRYSVYDWGWDPGGGDPVKHWRYHEPIYQECRRVLKPGGVLAWSAFVKFYEHFAEWFGGHRVWALTRCGQARTVSGNIWVVQTKDQQPVPFPPDRDGVIFYKDLGRLRKLHPCVKAVEEMLFRFIGLSCG
jgi:hypothetical protein